MEPFDSGPNSVQALYLKGPYEMVFEWGDTSPFNYDFFNVRWDMDGTNMGQSEVKGVPREPAENGSRASLIRRACIA